MPTHQIVSRGIVAGAGRSADLRHAHRAREPDARGHRRADRAGIAQDLDTVFDLFPVLGERIEPAGGHPIRWRAADAGDRPGTDGRPQLVLLDEPSLGLAPMIVNRIFDVIRGSRRPGDDPAGRAECAEGAGHRGSRLCPGDRADQPERAGAPSWPPIPRSSRRISVAGRRA